MERRAGHSNTRAVSASATCTITAADEDESVDATASRSSSPAQSPASASFPSVSSSSLVIRLQSEEQERRHVRWTEDTIDNEHLNRKKSNICCIFHRHNDGDEEEDCTCPASPNSAPEAFLPPKGKNAYEYQPPYHRDNKDPESRK
jgi:protein phosphatase 1 regulatory subunit 11